MRIPDVAGRNLRDRTKLDRVVDQRSLDQPAPHADLAAPVLLGVGRAHDVAAQASFEIDALAPEGRELGSDLAIGHGTHGKEPPQAGKRYLERILISQTDAGDRPMAMVRESMQQA